MKRCPTVPVAPSTPTLTIFPSGTEYIDLSGGDRDRVKTTVHSARPAPFRSCSRRYHDICRPSLRTTSNRGCSLLMSCSITTPYTTSNSSPPASLVQSQGYWASRTGSALSSLSLQHSSLPSYYTFSTSKRTPKSFSRADFSKP